MKNFIANLNNLKFFFISLVSTFLTFVINFFLLPVKPDYFICNNLKDYDFLNFNFQYPISCDQESYYSAIRDLSTLFNEGYVYQGRPLYILVNSVIANFLNISTFGSIDNFDNVIHVSIIIFHTIVISISGYLFFKIFEEKINKNYLNIFLVSFTFSVSPLFKWGSFDPSNQTLTLLVIMLMTYLYLNFPSNLSSRTSLLIGFLVLFHRTFIVGYILLWLLFFIEKKLNFKLKIIIKTIKQIFIALIPFLIYNLYIIVFQEQVPYDENSSHYGQFLWLPLYLFTSRRYEGGWHCMEIPQFIQCYLIDNFYLILYLLVPVCFIVLNLLTTKYEKFQELGGFIKFTFMMYLFYMFIGWYPPIRFSYYSVGHLIILLSIFFMFNQENKILKFLYIFSTYLYFIFLNHWNHPNTLDLNYGIYISFLLILFYVIYKIGYKKYEKSD